MQQQRRRIIRLTIITLVSASLLAVAATILLLYRTALDFHAERLSASADTLAQHLSAATRNASPPSDEAISALIARHHLNDGLSTTIEVVVARPHDGTIQLLLASHRGQGQRLSLPPTDDSEMAIRLALQGKRGTCSDSDAHGYEFFSAYRPLPEFNGGVVVRIRYSEIRQPFFAAAFGAAAIILVIVLLLPYLYTRLIAPLFNQYQERYHALVELSPYGVMVVDSEDGAIITFNHVAHELLGYSADEFGNLRIADIEALKTTQEIQEHIAQILTRGQDEFDTLLRTKAGELRNAHVHIKTFQFDGRTAFHAIFRDITLQKQAEYDLQRSHRHLEEMIVQLRDEQERYRTLVELSPYGVIVVDVESGDTITFNRIAHEQLGYSAGEFSQMHIQDYDVGKTPQELQHLIEEAITSGQEEFDTVHRSKSGELRNVHLHVTTFYLDGRITLHAIVRDITEEVAAQIELERYRDHLQELVDERSRELLQTNQELEKEIAERIATQGQLDLAEIVYRNTLEGVFVTNAEGNILTVNPAFCEITGYSSDEAVGHNPRMLKSYHQPPEFYREMWATLLLSGRWQGEIWNRRKNGEAYLQQLTITMVRNHDGKPRNYVAVFSDITELRQNEERIRYQAYHDALTGLPNRILFQDRLRQALHQAGRSGEAVAVLFLDLDRFKVINDTLGHHVGDELLRRVAERLSHLLRQSDTVSRFGGDEFVILLTEITDIRACEEVAEKIITLFEQTISIEQHDLVISTSIGIALFPSDGLDSTTLMRNADAAMYNAKESGRNNFKFYRAEMNAQAVQRMTIEHRLRKAIENSAFILHYQPRVDLASGVINGVEALIRWNDPEHGMISPADFIPIAEESGLIVPIGNWVLENACQQAKLWHEQGYTLRVSVNISARQFTHASLIEIIDRLLQRTGLSPSSLELELTESLIMQNAEQSIETLNRLKELGVLIAVDDFGTGYSSLSYLKRFPIDVLKVDKSFVNDIVTDSNDAAIVETIIALGKSLQIEVLAEGVETVEQLDFLHQRGCQTIQGYYFSRPLPPSQMTLMLEQDKQLYRRGER